MITAQGGNANCADDCSLFPQAKIKRPVLSRESGYIKSMDAGKCGAASSALGAGRNVKGGAIDYAAGIYLMKKPGDYVSAGETIAYLYTNRESACREAETIFMDSLGYSAGKPETKPLVYKIIK